ncbi:MAG TPA: hypothetical protein VLN26_08035 [Gaiellaceae bacterium]|nr:hypothetical protein [Gaiellaceae bacterium]
MIRRGHAWTGSSWPARSSVGTELETGRFSTALGRAVSAEHTSSSQRPLNSQATPGVPARATA